jgi:hypothetical protein
LAKFGPTLTKVGLEGVFFSIFAPKERKKSCLANCLVFALFGGLKTTISQFTIVQELLKIYAKKNIPLN